MAGPHRAFFDPRIAGIAALAALVSVAPASAQISDNVIRIGIINDQSGVYSGTGGPGSTLAAQMAAEDLGGKINGATIEIVSGDHQNKPDLASLIVREWFDAKGFDAVADGASSAAALAVQELARERKKVFLISGAGSSDFTGKACSPTGFQFAYDTYGLSNSTTAAMVKQGYKNWFMLTADYAFGLALERDARDFLTRNGGSVVGYARHPFGTHDFSSFLMTADASKAQVIGLANGGTDFSQALKQAAEFKITNRGKKLVSLSGMISDIHAVGLAVAEGTYITESFYWDLDEQTRNFSRRFMERNKGRPPTMVQAGVYAGVHHYLKAVAAAGTDDGPTVAKKMREMPVENFFHHGTRIREDGRVLLPMHLFKVKAPKDSKGEWDLYEHVMSTPGEQAFRPLADGGCPYITSGK
ncbi:MAG: ABC transporter substrate-binding protein [Burkholderiaceae bacterium]|nr:ABC transporter substrate-binding protein [Burkholderiaceae bacterium]